MLSKSNNNSCAFMNIRFLIAVLLLCLLASFSQNAVYADDSASLSPSIMPAISPIITMENKEIQYELPYPGILPDNPLYFLKTFRDTIVLFLISEPWKKADFDLQQADKLVNASIYLSNEKQVNDTVISSTF